MVWLCWVALVSVLTLWTSRTDAFSVSWPKPEVSSDIRRGETQEKRSGCHGFPCVFSHLGSKTSDATIERIKMSILMDCLNDPHCFTQAKRKRIPPSAVAKQRLMFGKRYSDFSQETDWASLVHALQKRKRK